MDTTISFSLKSKQWWSAHVYATQMFDLQSRIYWQKCQSFLTERHLRWGHHQNAPHLLPGSIAYS